MYIVYGTCTCTCTCTWCTYTTCSTLLGNWRIASQEYLAAVASNDITKSHNSILPPISVPVPVPEPEPNSSPDTPLTEMTRLKENQKGRYCKYYNNPEKCKV